MSTLAELIKINDLNLADINVSDLLQDAPLMAALYSVAASNGTQHKYLKQTTACGAGFRVVGDGLANAGSADTLVTDTLQYLDASFNRDIALARGYNGGVDAYIARESVRAMKSAMAAAEAQLIYGTAKDSVGFSAMAQALDNKDDAMVVDAGGTTQTTGSSVWLIRSGIDDVASVIGNDGMVSMSDWFHIAAAGSVTGTYTAIRQDISWYMSLQLGGAYSLARICNLTAESGKGLTDDLIADAISKFPASRAPNLVVMNRRSLKQLQNSRTATNATGAPAPFPVESLGVPIIVTDAITSTETLLTNAAT